MAVDGIWYIYAPYAATVGPMQASMQIRKAATIIHVECTSSTPQLHIAAITINPTPSPTTAVYLINISPIDDSGYLTVFVCLSTWSKELYLASCYTEHEAYLTASY